MVLGQLWQWQHHIFVELVDPRIATYPFFGATLPPPWEVMAVLFLYLYFIKSLGIRFMQNREPYKLNKIMIVYNFAQVVLSALTFYEGFAAGWGGRYNWFCQPFYQTDNTPDDIRGVRGCVLYFACKILDLLDTVFIVLRKNYRQLSFLHTYHHALMVVMVWSGIAYYPGGHLTFVGFINALVHTIMYAYYLLTAIDSKYKSYTNVKKWITRMQLAQFVLVFFHCAQVFVQPNCDVPRVYMAFGLLQSVIMISLFSNFYYQTYIKKKTA